MLEIWFNHQANKTQFLKWASSKNPKETSLTFKD